MCFYLKIVFFTVFFGLFCIFLLIGAVDFDGLFAVSLSGDFFSAFIQICSFDYNFLN